MTQTYTFAARSALGAAMVVAVACGDERGDGFPFTGADTTADGATTGAAADATGGSGTGGEAGGGGPKLDVGDGSNNTAGDGGDCDCGNDEWSYIFVANSGQSTVSKINTRTLEEEGRYLTREDSAGNPSRTSVSLTGRAVAVANRFGGVVKVWARDDLCDPMRNGVAGLQTSQGADDVLPWGEDDCVDWYTHFDYGTQRPIAWMGGDEDPQTCNENERVWIAGCDPAEPTAHLLDGDSGDVLETIPLTGFPCGFLGPYGGAVDADGNFWISDFGQDENSTLARVDAVTFAVDVWTAPLPAYGITVDHLGRVWLSGNGGEAFLPNPAGAWAARFDPATAQWDLAGPGGLGQSGIVEDAAGRVWINYWGDATSTGGLLPIDVETLQVGAKVPLPHTGKGISVDKDGNVWSIAIGGAGIAMRYDPATADIETYEGLTNPYTYSDMTGWALQNAWCIPEG